LFLHHESTLGALRPVVIADPVAVEDRKAEEDSQSRCRHRQRNSLAVAVHRVAPSSRMTT
jgi:hypothetical protein